MTLDDIPDQFEAVVGDLINRARTALNREIEKSRKAANALNTEAATKLVTLSQLQDQVKQAQTELDAVLASLGRTSSLVGLNQEITAARKTNEALKAENKALETSNAAMRKQLTDAERQLNAVRNDAQSFVAIRTEAEAFMKDIRLKLNSVEEFPRIQP